MNLRPDADAPGYFHLQLKNQRFHLRPVMSATGALRHHQGQPGRAARAGLGYSGGGEMAMGMADVLHVLCRCPVQILWGEEDQWIPIERGRALHAMIPGSQFHPIANAGHLVQEDAPEAIVTALLRFLPPH